MSFVPGISLCEAYYREAVFPVLRDAFPEVPYAAGLVDGGSEVLGFDTAMSMDHDWGPRVQIFLCDEDLPRCGESIGAILSKRLPRSFGGFSTSYELNMDGTGRLVETDAPLRHRVNASSPQQFFHKYLGVDLDEPLKAAGWLAIPQQELLTVSRGPIFHDGIGFGEMRDRFAFYPRDVWIYQLAALWTRVGQEEHLVGRAGFVGDELGAAIIASRLVRDLMRLAFLIERQYAPYAKWLGTAFSRLSCSSELGPLLQGVVDAKSWQNRDECLVPAFEKVARMQNELVLCPERPAKVGLFFDRPFHVIELHAGFSSALIKEIEDSELKRRPVVGGIDILSDSTDFVGDASWRETTRKGFSCE